MHFSFSSARPIYKWIEGKGLLVTIDIMFWIEEFKLERIIEIGQNEGVYHNIAKLGGWDNYHLLDRVYIGH